MHFLIDGHNLIANTPDIDLSDPHDEVHLVLLLRSWAAASRRRRVTVIFDGGLPGGQARRISGGPVKVIFAPHRMTADELIIARIKKVKNQGGLTLVTADREIIAMAHRRGVRHMSPGHFARELRPREVDRSDKLDRADPQLDEAEIDEWLALFGPDPEMEPRRKTTKKKGAPEEVLKDTTEDNSLETPKEGDRLLSKEEVDLWLSLFGDSNED